MRTARARREKRWLAAVSPVLLGLVLIVGALWTLGNPGPVHACKCAQPGSPSEELEKFSAVFAGRVVSIQHSYDPDGVSVSPEDRSTVGIEVSAVWKGIVHEDMYITTPPTGGSWWLLIHRRGRVHHICLRQPICRRRLYSWYMQSNSPPRAGSRRYRRTAGGAGTSSRGGWTAT